MKPPSSTKVPVSGWVVAAMSVASSAHPQTPPPAKSESNAIEFVASDGMFQAPGDGSQTLADMRARLDDPQQRAKMREDQRRSIADSHYGVAEALQLDAATLEKLIEVLTDQQMERSESFYKEFTERTRVADPAKRTQAEAEHVTRQIQALREVLGQEKLERYQVLQPSLPRRTQIRELDERLADADKLNVTQRERLVELMQEQVMTSIERTHPPHFERSLLHDMLNLPSREDRQRQLELHNIAANEESWRELRESNGLLRKRAAEFLADRQLAALEQTQAEQLAAQQRNIERMRVQAGLVATIPEQPQVVKAPPAAVDRDLKLSLKVAVDSESPRYLTTVVSSGKSVSLKIAENLSLEATAIVFENDAYNLRVEYFETGVTGRRVIGNMGLMGMLESEIPEAQRLHMRTGGGNTVIAGSRGYAVELSTRIEPT